MSLERPFEEPGRPGGEPVGGMIRHERRGRSIVAEATLACPDCDAPLLPGDGSVAIGATIECPYCARSGQVREFLSLDIPTRATRVYIRTSLPEDREPDRGPAGGTRSEP